MVIQPTVGRKVWFHAGSDHAEMNVINTDQPLDATVLFVHGARSVNLFVVDHMGHKHFVEKAHLSQPSDETLPESYATWMPYQVGQATKESTPPM